MRYFALYNPNTDLIVAVEKEIAVKFIRDNHINIYEYIDITEAEYSALLELNFNVQTYHLQAYVNHIKNRPRFRAIREISFVEIENASRPPEFEPEIGYFTGKPVETDKRKEFELLVKKHS